MPRKVRFAPGWLMRPLLAQSRAQIESYARHHQLAWLEDPSNQQQRFGRNFLRHQVMPLLRDKWPGVDETIARSARHMAEAGGLLDSMAWRTR